MSERVLDELGFYLLAGQPETPRELLQEAEEGEALGLGTAFISERYQSKEAATLCGAAAAITERIRIATAVTNHNTRHPMVTAGFALTMHGLSGGRFVLGLGSQVKPHIERRFSMPWSRPAARMREIALAVKAIFARWEGKAELDFRGEFYRHTLMIPAARQVIEPALVHPLDGYVHPFQILGKFPYSRLVGSGLVQVCFIDHPPARTNHLESRINSVNIFPARF